MKLPIVNNKRFFGFMPSISKGIWPLYLLFLALSCAKISPESTIIGNWNYVAVTQDNKPFLPVDPADVLILDSNNFNYSLRLANIKGSGTWEILKPDTLVLYYSNTDTTRDVKLHTRYFKIHILTQHRLEFQEHDVLFQFDRF